MRMIFKFNMKAISLLSGGKDSFLSTVIAQEQGLEVVCCVTVEPVKYSEMFHVPNYKIAKYVAKLIGLDTVFISETNFYKDLLSLAEKLGARAIISGAIASNFQKTRIEKFCTENNLLSYSPLWLMDQENELRSVILSGIRPIIVSVSAEGLGHENLGKVIDQEMISELMKLRNSLRINIAGEGGEYESLVIGFNKKILKIQKFEDVMDGSMAYRKIDKIELQD